jgi:GNAT superfamily N-acetyltransferase
MVEYNREKIGEVGATATIALGLRNRSNEAVKGGLWGEIYWNWLTIYLLIIPRNLRGQGVGSSLLQRAEALARQYGCIGVYLDTFSFQTPDFYRMHGYEAFGELSCYPNANARIFLRKLLNKTGETPTCLKKDEF